MFKEKFIVISIKSHFRASLTLKEIMESLNISFNYKEAHLIGIEITNFYRELQLCFFNFKFEEVKEDNNIPVYTLEKAKKMFPFLFN